MEQSRRCALSANNEFACFGCQHRTMSAVWTAQTSHAQYIAAKYLPGCVAVYNPSKQPCRSSLGNLYLSYCFLSFFVLHTKNHATYFYSDKLNFKTKFCFINIIMFWMLPSCRVIFPHPPHNIVMRVIPLEFVLCISNLFKIKIIIYLQLH
jgi:hypothetical protein